MLESDPGVSAIMLFASFSNDSAPRPRLMAMDLRLMELSDEDLMVRYRGGEGAAFDVLVRRHRDPVLNFLFRMTRNRPMAEEVEAEVFYRLHRAAPRYEPTARFTTWLYTIAYRQCLSVLQRKENRLKSVDVPAEDLERVTTRGQGGSNPPDAENRLLMEERMQKLTREVADLPEAHRAAFLLYYQEEMNCIEIAEVLALSPEEVKGRLAYARRLLRERLGVL